MDEPAGLDDDGAPLLDTVDAGRFEGVDPPARREIIPGLLQRGIVTLVGAAGGDGKSLLLQQAASCIATGTSLLGLPVVDSTPCLIVNAEDDWDELQRRQVAIMPALGLDWPALAGRLHLACLAGAPPADLNFGTFDRRVFRPGPALLRVERTARALEAGLVVLDNRAQFFWGDLNDPAEVTAFVNALSGMAKRLQAAVVLVTHRAKGDGSEFAGTAAWENAARCRWWLRRDAVDREERILSVAKSNYGATGHEIRFRWRAGAFALSGGAGDPSPREAAADAAVLGLVEECFRQQRTVSAKPGRNYGPSIWAEMPRGAGFSKAELARAMERLLAAGALIARAALPWKDESRHQAHGLVRSNA